MLDPAVSFVPQEKEGISPLPDTVNVPANFAWTEKEAEKLRLLARNLNCSVEVASELLVYFLRHIQQNRRGLAVARLPELLAGFPVKWGYKKKRNDFLKLLHDLDFIFVEVNYWAKVRAKQYGLAPAGRDLMERLARHPSSAGTRGRIDPAKSFHKPYATLPVSASPLANA